MALGTGRRCIQPLRSSSEEPGENRCETFSYGCRNSPDARFIAPALAASIFARRMIGENLGEKVRNTESMTGRSRHYTAVTMVKDRGV
jgi:hypothetical protein